MLLAVSPPHAQQSTQQDIVIRVFAQLAQANVLIAVQRDKICVRQDGGIVQSPLYPFIEILWLTGYPCVSGACEQWRPGFQSTHSA